MSQVTITLTSNEVHTLRVALLKQVESLRVAFDADPELRQALCVDDQIAQLLALSQRLERAQ